MILLHFLKWQQRLGMRGRCSWLVATPPPPPPTSSPPLFPFSQPAPPFPLSVSPPGRFFQRLASKLKLFSANELKIHRFLTNGADVAAAAAAAAEARRSSEAACGVFGMTAAVDQRCSGFSSAIIKVPLLGPNAPVRGLIELWH